MLHGDTFPPEPVPFVLTPPKVICGADIASEEKMKIKF